MAEIGKKSRLIRFPSDATFKINQDRHDISYIRALGLLLLFAASHTKCIAILRARSWGSIALRRDRCTIVALGGIAAICTIYSKFKVQRSWPCLSRQNMHFRQYSFLEYQ